MTDSDNFSNPSKFNRSIRLIEDELNHTKEDFINHFKETYTNQYPPSWMLAEILPFGVISIRAIMPVRMSRPWITLPTDPLKVYFDMCVIKYFLDIISPNNDMLDKMNSLFVTFPEIDKAALGFPSGWENEPLWK